MAENSPDASKREGKLLADLIDMQFDSRIEFAELLGVSKNVLSDLCTGRTRLKGARRVKAARLLGVDPETLTKDSVEADPPKQVATLGREIPIARTGHRFVPVYGALAAGQMSYTHSDVLEWEELPEWGGDFERWGRVVVGNSMEPEFLEGDIVIFENRQHEDGHAVHAFAEGEDTFKIYVKTKEGERLRPMNQDYDDLEAKKYTIKGIVVQRIRAGQERGTRDRREYSYGFRHRFKT